MTRSDDAPLHERLEALLVRDSTGREITPDPRPVPGWPAGRLDGSALTHDEQRTLEIELAWTLHRWPPPRLSTLKRLRDLWTDRQGGLCCWCDEPTTAEPGPKQATLEHITPRARGGEDTEENTAMACRACNGARGHGDEWPTFVRKRQAPPATPPREGED